MSVEPLDDSFVLKAQLNAVITYENKNNIWRFGRIVHIKNANEITVETHEKNELQRFQIHLDKVQYKILEEEQSTEILEQIANIQYEVKQSRSMNEETDSQDINMSINVCDKMLVDDNANDDSNTVNKRMAKLKPLDYQQISTVNQTLSKYPNTVIAKHTKANLEVKVKDLLTLQGRNWLNDEIINFYIALLQDRNAKRTQNDPTHKKIIFMNSFFWTKLCGYKTTVDEKNSKKVIVITKPKLKPKDIVLYKNIKANVSVVKEDGRYQITWQNNTATVTREQLQLYKYKEVERWTKKAKLVKKGCVGMSNIFDCDKFIFPVHLNNVHWSLGCINFGAKNLEYYDSMFGKYLNSSVFFRTMKQYLKDEWKTKVNSDNNLPDLNVKEWKEFDNKDTYEQQRK
eukprot:360419_1